MNYCKEYESALNALIDGACSPEEETAARAHLETCPGCRAYLGELLALRDAFPDGEDTEVPDGFAESVSAAIRADAAPQKTPVSRWMKAALPLAACLALALGVGLRSGGMGSSAAGGAAASAEAAPSMTYSEAVQAQGAEEGFTAASGAPALAQNEGKSAEKAELQGSADASGETAEYALRAAAALSDETRRELLGDYEAAEEDGFLRYELDRETLDSVLRALDRQEIPVELTTGGDGQLCCLDVYPE